MIEREEYTKIKCKITVITDKAFRIELDDGREVWVPRSVCMLGHRSFDLGGDLDLAIASWFCEKEELS